MKTQKHNSVSVCLFLFVCHTRVLCRNARLTEQNLTSWDLVVLTDMTACDFYVVTFFTGKLVM